MPEAKPDPFRRQERVSPRLYLIVGALLVGLPIGGFFAADWYAQAKRSARECFTRPVREYPALAEKYDGLAVSADGRRALGWKSLPEPPSSPAAAELFFLDLESGRELKSARLDGWLDVRAALSADGGRAAVLAWPGPGGVPPPPPSSGSSSSRLPQAEPRKWTIYTWSLAAEELPEELVHWSLGAAGGAVVWAGSPDVFTISPDGRRLLVNEPGGPGLREIDTGRVLRHLAGQAGDLSAAAFSPDGARALTAGQDNTVRLWSLEDGRELRRFPVEACLEFQVPNGLVGCYVHPALAFTPDGRRALIAESTGELTGPRGRAISTWTGRLRLWDLDSGAAVRELAPPGRAEVELLAVSPDGRLVLGAGRSPPTYAGRPVMWLWRLDTGALVRHYEFPPAAKIAAVEQVLFLPGGREVLSVGTHHQPGMRRPEAIVLRWRLPTAFELRLLGTEAEAPAATPAP